MNESAEGSESLFRFGIYFLIRSYFPLSVSIFCFLKKKAKGFPLLSGLVELFPEEDNRFPEERRRLPAILFS